MILKEEYEEMKKERMDEIIDDFEEGKGEKIKKGKKDGSVK